MVEYTIISNEGVNISFAEAVELLGGLIPYDPWDEYGERSDAYIATVLDLLKRDGKIRNYKISGDFEPLPNQEGVEY